MAAAASRPLNGPGRTEPSLLPATFTAKGSALNRCVSCMNDEGYVRQGTGASCYLPSVPLNPETFANHPHREETPP